MDSDQALQAVAKQVAKAQLTLAEHSQLQMAIAVLKEVNRRFKEMNIANAEADKKAKEATSEKEEKPLDNLGKSEA